MIFIVIRNTRGRGTCPWCLWVLHSIIHKVIHTSDILSIELTYILFELIFTAIQFKSLRLVEKNSFKHSCIILYNLKLLYVYKAVPGDLCTNGIFLKWYCKNFISCIHWLIYGEGFQVKPPRVKNITWLKRNFFDPFFLVYLLLPSNFLKI